MRIVSIIHSAGHEMPMLVDRDGLPISDPNEWFVDAHLKLTRAARLKLTHPL